jgi:hypothetical protein
MSVRASRRARCAHRTNPYKRECDFCRSAASCSACRATADCEECTASARCGACRNVYSRLRRESGYSSTRLVPHSNRPASSPLLGPAPALDVLDVPRTRSGLGTYYRLLATTTPAVTHSGGRWLFDESSAELLHVELIEPKDQYETPAWVWQHAVRTFALRRDAHASPLNVVLPLYDSRLDEGPVPGSRYWLSSDSFDTESPVVVARASWLVQTKSKTSIVSLCRYMYRPKRASVTARHKQQMRFCKAFSVFLQYCDTHVDM